MLLLLLLRLRLTGARDVYYAASTICDSPTSETSVSVSASSCYDLSSPIWQRTGEYRRAFLRHSSLLRRTALIIGIIEHLCVSVWLYCIRSEVNYAKWILMV